MADRPILFSGPMVRAILDSRKTQTRRVIKPYDSAPHPFQGDKPAPDLVMVPVPARLGGMMPGPTFRLPYAPGDRLWVRESWQGLSFGDYQPTKSNQCDVRYKATERLADLSADVRGYPWRPSIFMPRWASRLTLLVTCVRVQRLHDISEDDAIAEGCRPFFDHDNATEHVGPNGTKHQMAPLRGPLDDFRRLWDSLNAKRGFGWEASPWVCAITFTAQQCNIDRMEAAHG